MKSFRIAADRPDDLPSFAVLELRAALLTWYSQSGRNLPWRQTRDPYAIWVSEIMLQQTQVKTVVPYFDRWMSQFPTIQALAKADLQSVLKVWEGLGYYARARNLHRAAQDIVHQHDGTFPTELEVVLALPGIGRTTAGGILSAAFNQPLAILDGNVKRVLARVIALEVPTVKALPRLWKLSQDLVDPQHGRDFNQAFMDLGATVCTPHNPACLVCPWQRHCRAYNLRTQSQIPMTETRAPVPHKQIGVAVIWNDRGQILIDRRKPDGLLGGLWEFPGGKVELGETIEACIQREIQEELGIEIAVGDRLIVVDHAYTHFRVTLNVHHCRHLSGDPQAIACDEIRWVTLAELDQFPFPKANLQIIAALRQSEAQSSCAPLKLRDIADAENLMTANVEIYTWSTCPYCVRAKSLLDRKGVDYTEYNLDGDEPGRAKMSERANGKRSVPQIFVNDQLIGGCDDIHALDRQGKLDPLLQVS